MRNSITRESKTRENLDKTGNEDVTLENLICLVFTSVASDIFWRVIQVSAVASAGRRLKRCYSRALLPPLIESVKLADINEMEMDPVIDTRLSWRVPSTPDKLPCHIHPPVCL